MTTEFILTTIVLDTPLEGLLFCIFLLIIAPLYAAFWAVVFEFIGRLFEKIIYHLEDLYEIPKKMIAFVLLGLKGIYRFVIKVVKNPRMLFSVVTERHKSREVFSQKNLEFIFNRAQNKEEIVGDLLSEYARMKKKLLDESLNPKKYKKELMRVRGEMLKQIFSIKVFSIKTKIENIFSNKKKKIDD